MLQNHGVTVLPVYDNKFINEEFFAIVIVDYWPLFSGEFNISHHLINLLSHFSDCKCSVDVIIGRIMMCFPDLALERPALLYSNCLLELD